MSSNNPYNLGEGGGGVDDYFLYYVGIGKIKYKPFFS